MCRTLPNLKELTGPTLKVPMLGELKVTATVVMGTKGDADPENVAGAHTARLDELALATTNAQPPPAGENDDEIEEVPTTVPDPDMEDRIGPRADLLSDADDTIAVPIVDPLHPLPLR
jgi:hypothetical protein